MHSVFPHRVRAQHGTLPHVPWRTVLLTLLLLVECGAIALMLLSVVREETGVHHGRRAVRQIVCGRRGWTGRDAFSRGG